MARRRTIIRDDRRGFDDLRRELRQLAGRQHVVIGITHEAGGEVLEYANANEFGTRDGHIPSRPFMRTYYDTNLKKIGDFAANQFLKMITQRGISVTATFESIGLYVQNGVKGQIRNSPKWAKPNAPYTVYKKLMKNRAAVGRYVGMKLHDRGEHHYVSKILAQSGPSGTKPLIDHGIMINSVTFDIRRGR